MQKKELKKLNSVSVKEKIHTAVNASVPPPAHRSCQVSAARTSPGRRCHRARTGPAAPPPSCVPCRSQTRTASPGQPAPSPAPPSGSSAASPQSAEPGGTQVTPRPIPPGVSFRPEMIRRISGTVFLSGKKEPTRLTRAHLEPLRVRQAGCCQGSLYDNKRKNYENY